MSVNAKQLLSMLLAGSACLSLSPATSALTGPVADWKVFPVTFPPDFPTPPGSDLDTDSPAFGDGTERSANQTVAAGLFGANGSPQSLTLTVGQTLTASADFTITGGDARPEQYRFGIYNEGGQFANDTSIGWAGGFTHVFGGTLSTARTNGDFISFGPDAVRLFPDRDLSPVIFDSDVTTPYTWTMSITRDSATTIDLVSSVVGGDVNYDETFTLLDYTTNQFTFNAMGLLVGLTSNAERFSVFDASFELTTPPTLGDLNGDGQLTNGDINAFVLALTDPTGYASTYPGIDPDELGDFTGDGALTNGDINGFVAALTGGASAAVPEPASLTLLALGGLLAMRRRRRA